MDEIDDYTWEAARKIYNVRNAKMVKEVFGADANYVIHHFTASKVIEKIEMHEKFLEIGADTDAK